MDLRHKIFLMHLLVHIDNSEIILKAHRPNNAIFHKYLLKFSSHYCVETLKQTFKNGNLLLCGKVKGICADLIMACEDYSTTESGTINIPFIFVKVQMVENAAGHSIWKLTCLDQGNPESHDVLSRIGFAFYCVIILGAKNSGRATGAGIAVIWAG